MATQELVKADAISADIERVLLGGDLSKLTPEQRLSYYNAVCKSLGLNPLTRPFDYIQLNGKLQLYAKRDCTEQLRKINGVSITNMQKERFNELFVVTVSATDKTGRLDTSTGAVNLDNLRGEQLANAIMKAETKAKRRVTLSICGLGLLDETEVASVPGAQPEKPSLATMPKGTPEFVLVRGQISGFKASETAVTYKIDKTAVTCVDAAHDALLMQVSERHGEVEVEAVEKFSTAKNKKYLELVTIKKIDGREYTEGALRESLAKVAPEKLLEVTAEDTEFIPDPADDLRTGGLQK